MSTTTNVTNGTLIDKRQLPCEERIDDYQKTVEEDLQTAFDLDWDDKDEWSEKLLNEYGSHDDFWEYLNNYGLCFDYVDLEYVFDHEENGKEYYVKVGGYWRWQIATGGPGYEYRFYMDDPEDTYPDETKFYFLDWHDGASRDANTDLLDEIWGWFSETRGY